MNRRSTWLALVVLACSAAGCDPESPASAEPPKVVPAQHAIEALPSASKPVEASAKQPAASGALPAEPAAKAAPSSAPVIATTGPRFANATFDQDEILRQIASADPLSFKPVGSTSTVFRMRLSAPIDAAFKSVTADRPMGPLAEVAAYRLSRCLGMDNVPPAVSRALPLRVLRERLEPSERDRWEKIERRLKVTADGMVPGVAIYWIPDLSSVGLDGKKGQALAMSYVRADGEIPELRRALAGSLSTMLAFDYLVGNFDRWSGGNVRGDAQAKRVYIRDHDLAFPAKMRESLHRRLWRDISAVERFSRAFYAGLRALDETCFLRELSADEGAFEHLSDLQIAGVLDRKQALLSHIDALIALRGQDKVLVFE